MSHDVAADLRDELAETYGVGNTFINGNGDVYVEVEDLNDIPAAVTIGHDYGWTPNGLINTGSDTFAFRLRPRHLSQDA